MQYLIVLFRTFIFYVLIMLIYRFMGKREIGQLGIVDLIVSILIAELVAISIDNIEESIFLSIFPILLLTFIQVGVSYFSLKNSKIRRLFDGNPSVIINKGKVNFKEMVKQRYNLDDLLVQLREKDIKSIEEVEYAVLETSGKLSIFRKKDKNFKDYPFPLILDSKIDYEVLNKIGKDSIWLNKLLDKENVNVSEIFYAFYTNKKLFIIKKDELNK